jgi:hypothetical protein
LHYKVQCVKKKNESFSGERLAPMRSEGRCPEASGSGTECLSAHFAGATVTDGSPLPAKNEISPHTREGL